MMKIGIQTNSDAESAYFKQNKGRNLVAVIAILMTAIMFTTLFTLAQEYEQKHGGNDVPADWI